VRYNWCVKYIQHQGYSLSVNGCECGSKVCGQAWDLLSAIHIVLTVFGLCFFWHILVMHCSWVKFLV
jgi:hypothetical protein